MFRQAFSTRVCRGGMRGLHLSARNFRSCEARSLILFFSIAWPLADVRHSVRIPDLLSFKLHIPAGLAAVNVVSGDGSAAQPDSFRCCRLGDTGVFSRASPNVGQCGYQPAFSNGFTSRRTVFDAPLAWPPGWANNMPPCFISQLCCLGDRLVWVVGLPPERFVTRRLPSLRTASNADECQKQSRAARNASPAVWRILPAVRTKSHSSSGLDEGARKLGAAALAVTCRGRRSISRVHEEENIVETSKNAWALSARSNAFQRLSRLGSTDSKRLREAF